MSTGSVQQMTAVGSRAVTRCLRGVYTSRLLVAVTLAETLAIAVWAMGSRGLGIYHPRSIALFGLLFLGLSFEAIYGSPAYGGRRKPATGVALAAMEVVVWANWGIILGYGLYSKHGIGVGAFVLFGGLALLHVLERKVLSEASWSNLLSPREGTTPLAGVFVTAGAEAVAATAFWALLTRGYPLAGILAMFVLITVEHAARREHLGSAA